jgi:hypothetical protein
MLYIYCIFPPGEQTLCKCFFSAQNIFAQSAQYANISRYANSSPQENRIQLFPASKQNMDNWLFLYGTVIKSSALVT